MSRPWGNEVVYHLFVDRFRNGDPELDVRPGAFAFHGRPVATSKSKRALTGDRTHQHTFYNGDLKGIRDALPYLQDLGVTVLLLTPIFASRSTHRYDTDDYLRLDPHVGTDADFEGLVDDLHRRGMKLALDGVFGHTSFEHPWYRDPALRRKHYRLRPDGTAETWLGWGVLPKLDTDDPETQDKLLEVIDRWKGVDAWRLDAAQHLPESFLRRFRARLKARNPEAIVIAEEWEAVASQLRDGLYDGVLNFQFRRPVVDFFRGEIGAEAMVRRLSVYLETYPGAALRHCWNLLDNHDTERFFGNFARDAQRLRPALALQTLLPGTPHLYYGDEIGMTARNSHESRAPMVWEPRRWDRAVLEAYREFLGLRREHPVFAEGGLRWVHASNRARTVAFVREDATARALVAVNAGDYDQAVAFEGRQVIVKAHDARVVFT
ncbi:MAG TPA: glycoside hydrolase family 13 protein [Pantanalinema sp.]